MNVPVRSAVRRSRIAMMPFKRSSRRAKITRLACSAASIQVQLWTVLVELWPSGRIRPRRRCECLSGLSELHYTDRESFYQEHLGKILKDKYGQLSAAMDKIINEANTEISTLQEKINSTISHTLRTHQLTPADFSIDQRTLQDKYDDLANSYREKSKKAAQAQQLYDALKKKVLMRGVETAASADANQTLQSIDARGAQPTHHDQQPLMERHQTHFDPPERQLREHEQDGHRGISHQQQGYVSNRSSDSGRFGNAMGPPSRTAARRLGTLL
jgi:E3 ubiquitin-protein ligase CCNP1IP1